MSGDLQTKKRRGKAKKKDEPEEEILESRPKASSNSHKSSSNGSISSGGGGGSEGSGIVAKIIFLILLVALAAVVGLILIELRGKQVGMEKASVVPKSEEPVVQDLPKPSLHVEEEPVPEVEEFDATPPLEDYVKVERPIEPPPEELEEVIQEVVEVVEEVPVTIVEETVIVEVPEAEEPVVPDAAEEPVEDSIPAVEVEEIIEEEIVEEPIQVVEVPAPVEVVEDIAAVEVEVVEEPIPEVEEPVPEVEEPVPEVEEPVPEVEEPVPEVEEPVPEVEEPVPEVEEPVPEVEEPVPEVEEPVPEVEEPVPVVEEPSVIETVEEVLAPVDIEESAPEVEEVEPEDDEDKDDDEVEEEERIVMPPIEEDDDDIDWSEYGREGGAGALTEAYLRVESLAEEVLQLDPENEMVNHLTPHLSGVLRAMEEGRTEGLLDTLSHIEVILADIKTRIEEPFEESPQSAGDTAAETVEAQPEIEPGVEAQAVADSKSADPEVEAQVEAEIKPAEAEVEAPVEAEIEPTEPEVEATVEAEIEPTEPEVEAQVEADIEPEVEAPVEAETEPVEAEAESEPVVDVQTEPVIEAEIISEVETEHVIETVGEAIEAETEAVDKPLEPESESFIEATEAEPVLEADSLLPAEPERATEAIVETEPVIEVETEPIIEAAVEPEAVEESLIEIEPEAEALIPEVEVPSDSVPLKAEPERVFPLESQEEENDVPKAVLEEIEQQVISPEEVAAIEEEDIPIPSITETDTVFPPGKTNEGEEPVPVEEIIPDPIIIKPLQESIPAPEEDIHDTKSVHDKVHITSDVDDRLRDELDTAEKLISENPREALNSFGAILHVNPKSARAIYGRAMSLDRLAEVEKSNSKLEQAIITYRGVIDLADEDPALVPLPLLRVAAEKCIDRMRFRGFFGKAVRVQQRLLQRFPDDLSLRNQMGVTFLLMNQPMAAKDVFETILEQWPQDGFAQVHYGFIMKTTYNNNSAGIEFIKKGIDSRAEGTEDGRFYFHLGDALQREGETQKAYQVYDAAVERGLFLSRYQRSLYNVDRLTSRPIWTVEQTPYTEFFRKLEANWEAIRDEGVALLNEPPQDGFIPEAENLQDTGDWKQYSLFTRGRKITANCVKAKVTCSLIEDFSPAANCKRGQVKFSVMKPNTHVHAHSGPTNCRLRSHLGLVIPSGVKLRIAEDTVQWKEGQVLLFDDSWEHEVWHEGNSDRLVLIVDVWHPDLTDHEMKTLSPI